MNGGYPVLIDPALDAREARLIWRPDPPTTLRLVRSAPLNVGGGAGLRIGDCGSLHDKVGDEHGTYFTARTAQREWRIHVADDVKPQDDLAFQIAADRYAQGRLDAAGQFLRELSGESGTPRQFPDARARRLHRDILQALDGAAAGASHRDIALALFGARRVTEHWNPDGHLRARVRYCLKRGRDLVRGGYRQLIYG
jgi:hypothetical protein